MPKQKRKDKNPLSASSRNEGEGLPHTMRGESKIINSRTTTRSPAFKRASIPAGAKHGNSAGHLRSVAVLNYEISASIVTV